MDARLVDFDPFDDGMQTEGDVGAQSEAPQEDFAASVRRQFEPHGALARATDGFVTREGQVAFAQAVARTIESRGTLVIEAGTGTGKTFAYMTPALMSGCKVIVSTAGKSLQDQLFNKDVPAVKRVLGSCADVAILKGRNNYLCQHRLEMMAQGGTFKTREEVEQHRRIRIFAQQTRTGDITEMHGVPETSPVWHYVTSTKENCLGKECEYASECWVNRARARARAADVVVVNHHLFLSAVADMTEGMPEDARLLPKADVVVFDEAHKLPEIASSFFGNELSTWQLRQLLREMKLSLLTKYRTYRQDDLQNRIRQAAVESARPIEEVAKEAQFAVPLKGWDELINDINHRVDEVILQAGLSGLVEGEDKNVVELKDADKLGACVERLGGACRTLVEPLELIVELDEEVANQTENLKAFALSFATWASWLADVQKAEKEGADKVRWLSCRRDELRFSETPLQVADNFRKLRESQAQSAWIFTSATIATGGENFAHFLSQLGLEGAETHLWASPFDYRSQSMIYVPRNMPESVQGGRRSYITALMRECWPVIDLLAGRTFILCTSNEAVQLATEVLQDLIDANDRDYTILAQGSDSRKHLIDAFREQANTILIATMSFWEGIDIKGDKLSLVVIDKLPFAPQNDPVLKARCRWIESQGKDPFETYQVPLATIALKQGAGRLIRSEYDRGILIVGDKRILPGAKRYSRGMLESLPPFVRTQTLGRVLDFWRYPDRPS
ncbi:MAG: ATP-dependent DNA helicase [Duodenibacillus sp.]|nr:ATP-dependent DNA helicase [Duodenibacillus sp.]